MVTGGSKTLAACRDHLAVREKFMWYLW